jgi:hypothetical protein
VRSVMDPVLPFRCSPGPPPPAPPPRLWPSLPAELMLALRRRVRLVWTSATLVGVMGRARRAAAAAADESELDVFGSRRVKADAAAVAAFGFAVAAVSAC